ncbi:hypothetical protein AMIS_75970 [Actinoplanes missouriensis 431]|uniref:Uncharacterized protein n=1 Tax=Actinoplanes missouriensis (strain ATCC 14538 / DSM 43046 / CBS 188.64 / JCM 3121 / NBRC 102363 / NCIMB 12654 / NRRL B-3342 / UNCC 431) TaxID=512565 RepID=I0HII0_ACTM4|nr:hypothetical protein [Actinoplanes missouriensis]BAL92817.1 hypothetical protein AMIS_75970 [Actinoplanes missouriensis 431]
MPPLTGLDLQHLTHAEDPWLLADRERPRGGSARIRQRLRELTDELSGV